MIYHKRPKLDIKKVFADSNDLCILHEWNGIGKRVLLPFAIAMVLLSETIGTSPVKFSSSGTCLHTYMNTSSFGATDVFRSRDKP